MSEKKPTTRIGRPPADTSAVNVRLPNAMIRALDDYRRTIPEIPTRPEVIRRIVAEFLEQEIGYDGPK